MTMVCTPGCVVLLIDESAGMGAVMGDVVTDGTASTKTNAERVATAVNSLIKRLADGPDFDLALVGYKSDAVGEVDVGSRWGGSLAGREFVKVREVVASPRQVEQRRRKVPIPGTIGQVREETVDFPVWYVPEVGVKAPQVAAYKFCQRLLEGWLAQAGPQAAPPLVVHLFAGASADGNPQMAVEKLLALGTEAGKVLLFQGHVAARAAASASLYPSTYLYLTVGSARDVFRRTSPLPPQLIEALKEVKVDVGPNARGMVYNAKIIDVIRLLGLVTAHSRDWMEELLPADALVTTAATDVAPAPVTAQATAAPPPAEGGFPPEVAAPIGGDELQLLEPVELATPVEPAAPALTDRSSLVVLVLDRSVADPFAAGTQNACTRLQDHANDLLTQISKLDQGSVEVAVVTYGQDSSGQPDVRSTFAGPLEGRAVVPHGELFDGAIRIEEYMEDIPNGMGGLISVKRKKPIYLDLEPTAAAPPDEALRTSAQTAADWCGQHPVACVPPVVLHLTRGEFDPAAIRPAAAPLLATSTAAGPLVLYHLVATEGPHTSLAYPETDTQLGTDALKALWSLSSPLLDRDRLAAEGRSVGPQAVGMVVNGKFDLFLDGIKAALAR